MNRSAPISTAPSRRGFLAVLSAGAASAVAPAALAGAPGPVVQSPTGDLPTSTATPSPDAALLQLLDQYMAARSEFCRLLGEEDRMVQRHNAENPMPDVLRVRPGDADLGLPELHKGIQHHGYQFNIMELKQLEWPVVETMEPPDGFEFNSMKGGEVVRFEPPSAAARARADDILKAHKKWRRRCNRQPAVLRTVRRQARAASKLADGLRDKIDRTRALTIAGLAVKAQVAAIEGEDDTQFADTTLASILRDLRALNGRAWS